MTAADPSRVEIYIDLYNINKYIRDKGLKLNFNEMVNKLAGGRRITEKYFFDSYVQYGFDPSRRMHDWMIHNGFIPKRIPYDPNRQEQKGVDMKMGLEMSDGARDNRCDVALIITGDGDFVPACEYVQAFGKKVEVAAFDEILSSKLKEKADRYYDLMCLTSPMCPSHTGTDIITRPGSNGTEAEGCY